MTDNCVRAAFQMAAACAVLAGCAPEQEPAREPIASDAAAHADSTFTPENRRVSLPTSRIYYTLTSYEWYARGEPLLHDGGAYRPEGMPVSASLTEMSRAGEFSGVEYYVRDGDPAGTVYVPVFQGYWQAFRLDPSAPATPADDAPSAAVPDSTAARD
ncbi:MAG TPA: hypothetical protein VFZ24_05825 [Longimicrobiales bacterium]